MLYKSEYGEVNFWDPYPQLNDYQKIGVNLSAGTDSALVMFMTLAKLREMNSNATVIPITGVHNKRPTNIWHANEIVLLFKEMFPDVNIGEHQVNHYDKKHEKDKVNHHQQHERYLIDNNIIDVLFHGRTANPLKEEGSEFDLQFKRETKRDKAIEPKPVFFPRYPFYVPLENVDKRFVADMYKQNGLMEELFPLTASCVEYGDRTNYFSEPCKKCWWCREKKWAFGMYDGGIQ